MPDIRCHGGVRKNARFVSGGRGSDDSYGRNDEFRTISGSNGYIRRADFVGESQRHDSPARAYKISVPTFETLYEKMNNEGVLRLDELSDDLKEQAKTRLNIYTVLNFVNMHYGSASCLAASSVFTAEKRFDGKIASSVVYLYIFETGIPIAVVFEPFGEKQFTAKGILLWAGDTSALSKVREVFEPFGCNVENIQQN